VLFLFHFREYLVLRTARLAPFHGYPADSCEFVFNDFLSFSLFSICAFLGRLFFWGYAFRFGIDGEFACRCRFVSLHCAAECGKAYVSVEDLSAFYLVFYSRLSDLRII
jgi:hypothetical protein